MVNCLKLDCSNAVPSGRPFCPPCFWYRPDFVFFSRNLFSYLCSCRSQNDCILLLLFGLFIKGCDLYRINDGTKKNETIFKHNVDINFMRLDITSWNLNWDSYDLVTNWMNHRRYICCNEYLISTKNSLSFIVVGVNKNKTPNFCIAIERCKSNWHYN